MSDLLMRDTFPLGAEVLKQIDETVEHVARQQLVGRRIVTLVGPLGAGAAAIPITRLAAGQEIRVGERDLLPFKTLYQDFILSWEELAAAQQSALPIDLSPVAEATARLARQEDELILDGLRGARKVQTSPLGEWEKSGGAFAAVAAGLEKLISAGVYGPYALVLSPSLYSQTQRVMADTGLLEISQIREMLGGEMYFSPAIKAKEAFLVANAPYNMDLVVAQDMITAYTASVGLDHSFRLIEKLVLRVKRPGAICILK